MIAQTLSRVLEATGYLQDGEPAAPSVSIGRVNQSQRYPSFNPEASWRTTSTSRHPINPSCSREITVYFKYVREPVDPSVARWQREVWNRGFTPLLWVVSDQRVDLYNGFSRPRRQDTASDHLLETFRTTDSDLEELALRAGRMSMETGQCWQNIPSLDRTTAVDCQLLQELRELKRVLAATKVKLNEVHELIIRSLFLRYLFDCKILVPSTLEDICGRSDLADVFDDRIAAQHLFHWLQDTFNGDMFPPSTAVSPDSLQLETVGRFFRGENPINRQRSLFPYQFDVIPVEFISATYEQFVHSSIHATQSSLGRSEVHYSPLSVVPLILDEVMSELSGNETVLDLTCGSGVFLVESLRRLVHLKAGHQPLSRNLILDTLYNQVYGIDKSGEAIRIAAFSLYLAALELDPTIQTDGCPKFRPIIGNTLFNCNAFSIHQDPNGYALLDSNGFLKRFDVVIGNPPWSGSGPERTGHRESPNAAKNGQPRDPLDISFEFLQRAIQFSHEHTRLGMIVRAMPFFAIGHTSRIAIQAILKKLLPVTLVNLSELSLWLLPNASTPAMIVLGRHARSAGDDLTLVQAHWSLRNRNSLMIEFAPSDVSALSFAAWEKKPVSLKAGFFGEDRDLSLLFDLGEHYDSLEAQLCPPNARFRTGFSIGTENRKDSVPLTGLPCVERITSNSGFSLSENLSNCTVIHGREARHQDALLVPFILVGRFLTNGPRPVVSIQEDIIVFDDAYYCVSFSAAVSKNICEVIAGILRSKLTSWYLLMTSSVFGLTGCEIQREDFTTLPLPDLQTASQSEAGRRICRFVNDYRNKEPRESEWEELDNAVFDLYRFNAAQRIALQDGHVRSRWQWNGVQSNSMQPADVGDLTRYANAFLGTMGAWDLSDRRQLCAEIYRFPDCTPIQVVRFFFHGSTCRRKTRVVVRRSSLSAALEGIASRTEESVTPQFVGLRELRVHSSNEVNIVKPAARRHWLGVRALSDADAVVRDFVLNGWSQR